MPAPGRCLPPIVCRALSRAGWSGGAGAGCGWWCAWCSVREPVGTGMHTCRFYRATAPAGAARGPFRISVRSAPVSRRRGHLCNDVQNQSAVWTIPHGAARVVPSLSVGPARLQRARPHCLPGHMHGKAPSLGRSRGPPWPSHDQSGERPLRSFLFLGPGHAARGRPITEAQTAPAHSGRHDSQHRLVLSPRPFFRSAPSHEVSCRCLPPSVPESSF